VQRRGAPYPPADHARFTGDVGLFDVVIDWSLSTLGLLWVGSIVAVARDGRARVSNPTATYVAVAATILLPFVGAVIWLCVRPGRTRLERREHRLLVRLAEQELAAAAPSIPAGRLVAPPVAPKREREVPQVAAFS
jgi:hypothetical protein